MKIRYSFIVLFSLCGSLYAQHHPLRQTICLLNYVPVIIESDPVIFRWKDQKEFETGTGRIRVRLLPRKSSFEFDHLIQKSTPLAFEAQEALSLFLVGDSSLIRSKSERRIANRDLLIDTVMQKDQAFFLVWKNPSGALVQEIGFVVQSLIPTIKGYRLNNNFDSLDNSVHAKQHKRKSYVPIGYEKMSGQRISIDPGEKLTLTLQTYPLLTDTVVQYRLTKKSDKQEGFWKMTGHILALPELVEGNAYELELRYPNQSEQMMYHLYVRPYWYQITWIQIVGLLLLVLLVIFATRFFYQKRLRKLNEQRKRLEEQLTTIQSQLSPHFIFNALNSIEGLIMDRETEEANHYLSIFSSILREALRNSDKMLISLQEEIELMEKYIQIEQLRFGFQYSIEIAADIHLPEIEVPPMLLQPVIENAVKHGAASLGEKGLIQLALRMSGSTLFICVTNNASSENKAQKTAGGHGLVFTKQRIQHLKALFPTTPIEFSLQVTQGSAVAVFEFQDWMA